MKRGGLCVMVKKNSKNTRETPLVFCAKILLFIPAGCWCAFSRWKILFYRTEIDSNSSMYKTHMHIVFIFYQKTWFMVKSN